MRVYKFPVGFCICIWYFLATSDPWLCMERFLGSLESFASCPTTCLPIQEKQRSWTTVPRQPASREPSLTRSTDSTLLMCLVFCSALSSNYIHAYLSSGNVWGTSLSRHIFRWGFLLPMPSTLVGRTGSHCPQPLGHQMWTWVTVRQPHSCRQEARSEIQPQSAKVNSFYQALQAILREPFQGSSDIFLNCIPWCRQRI